MAKIVLVPTDGSAQANKAVKLACDVAHLKGARLHLLHVLMHHWDPSDLGRLAELDGLSHNLRVTLAQLERAPLESTVPEWTYLLDPDHAPDRVPEQVLRQLGEEVLAAAKRLAEDKGLTDIRTEIVDGDPADQILAVAQREDATMIIMGHRGLRLIDELTEGSISNKVTRLATCDVVTIT